MAVGILADLLSCKFSDGLAFTTFAAFVPATRTFLLLCAEVLKVSSLGGNCGGMGACSNLLFGSNEVAMLFFV